MRVRIWVLLNESLPAVDTKTRANERNLIFITPWKVNKINFMNTIKINKGEKGEIIMKGLRFYLSKGTWTGLESTLGTSRLSSSR